MSNVYSLHECKHSGRAIGCNTLWCKKDIDNHKLSRCIAEEKQDPKVCKYYDGRGLQYTLEYLNEWHKEAVCEFD